MKKGLKMLLLGTAAALWMASPAAAEIKLHGVTWQFAKPGPRKPFSEIKRLVVVGSKLKGKVRAQLRLHNPSETDEEGVLVRYSMTAKLKHPVDGWEIWALPFMLDQRRIPKIKAGDLKRVSLDPTIGIKLYLKKVARWGRRIEAIKVRIMLEPRRGGKGKIQILESVLPIAR